MKRLLLAFLLIVSVPTWAQTFDTIQTATGDSVTSLSLDIAATGSNRLAVIGLRWFTPTATLSSVTYGGSAATLSSTVASFYDDRAHSAVYYFLAPSTSTTTVQVTWSDTVYAAALTVTTYTGVNQSTPLGNITNNEGNSTAPSATVTSQSGRRVYAQANGGGNSSAPTPDAGQTSRVVLVNWAGTETYMAVSDKAGETSTVLSWTIVNSAPWIVQGVELVPSSGASAVPVLNHLIRMKK